MVFRVFFFFVAVLFLLFLFSVFVFFCFCLVFDFKLCCFVCVCVFFLSGVVGGSENGAVGRQLLARAASAKPSLPGKLKP